MRMVCLMLSATFALTSRITTSELPPAANGTSSVIGRDGKSDCAWAETMAATASSTEPPNAASGSLKRLKSNIAVIIARCLLFCCRGATQPVDHRGLHQIGLELQRIVNRLLQVLQHGAPPLRIPLLHPGAVAVRLLDDLFLGDRAALPLVPTEHSLVRTTK